MPKKEIPKRPIKEILKDASVGRPLCRSSLLTMLQNIAAMNVGNVFAAPDSPEYHYNYLDDINYALDLPSEEWQKFYDFYMKALLIMHNEKSL